MLNKYTIENSLTYSSIQKTSHDIQNVRIYIEKQFLFIVNSNSQCIICETNI